MKSVTQKEFGKAPTVSVPRSTFDRSHGYKTTFDAGLLIPIFNDLAVPGDTMALSLAGFSRLATPHFPIMDNMIMDTFFFSIPIRLIWENWKKFCGEQIDPGDSISYSIPQTSLNNIGNTQLYSYFGLPTKVGAIYSINNLAARAYNLVWNEWFRDQNLQDSVVVDKGDGPDTKTDYNVLRRGKRHDYFTSCLPWLQKGDAVQLSLGSYAPVVSEGDGKMEMDLAGSTYKVQGSTGTVNMQFDAITGGGHASWSDTALQTDLASATASTVNELRQAVQIQRLLERDARSGTRYTEIVKSHFGVTSDDARQQRPEYLGGGSSPVQISPVARTDSSPGQLGAMGTSAFRGHGFNKSFTEHCIVLGMVCVRADLTYQEGIEKIFDYQTRYDMYWPTLAHLGEQAVLNREIYIDAATIGAGTDTDVFGYQERFAEMRYKPSKITGLFKSNDTATLEAWHLGIEFGAQPTLDDTFIQEDPPIDRTIVVPSEPHFLFDSYITLNHTRPLPVYSVPGFIDHF